MERRSSRPLLGLSSMRTLFICALAFPIVAVFGRAAGSDPVGYVNPLIGTRESRIGYGGTMPFVSPPFAMTNWTPQTRQNKISVTSYNYDDPTISGFIGTHQPAIWMGDYGYVTLMPEVGALRTAPDDRKLRYSHEDETVNPDYYAVSLATGDSASIRAEMTATERCAYFRFQFPKNGVARVLIEASRPGIAGTAAVDATRHEITGFNPHRMDAHLGPFKLPNFHGYFVVQFRSQWEDALTYGLADETAKVSRGAYAEFRPGELVEVRIGTSFLSIDQARANLETEIPQWDFEAVRQKLHAAWSDKLSRLQLDGATDREKTRLYTALYHALLYPRTFSEHGRYYSAFDDRAIPAKAIPRSPSGTPSAPKTACSRYSRRSASTE